MNDKIEDFYLDTTPSEDETIDSDNIENVSNTDASRPEERASTAPPIPSDFSPIQSQPPPRIDSPSTPVTRLH